MKLQTKTLPMVSALTLLMEFFAVGAACLAEDGQPTFNLTSTNVRASVQGWLPKS
ncbi:MAG: hypothetical protein ABSE16_18025 [Verrucomicrobiota bacterium]